MATKATRSFEARFLGLKNKTQVKLSRAAKRLHKSQPPAVHANHTDPALVGNPLPPDPETTQEKEATTTEVPPARPTTAEVPTLPPTEVPTLPPATTEVPRSTTTQAPLPPPVTAREPSPQATQKQQFHGPLPYVPRRQPPPQAAQKQHRHESLPYRPRRQPIALAYPVPPARHRVIPGFVPKSKPGSVRYDMSTYSLPLVPLAPCYKPPSRVRPPNEYGAYDDDDNFYEDPVIYPDSDNEDDYLDDIDIFGR